MGRVDFAGWRVPFLASVALIAVGLYIRVGILETPVFARLQTSGKVPKAPVVEVVWNNWREILLVAFMRTGQMAPFYIFVTYILVYGTQQLGLARGALLNLVMLTAVGSLVATPLWGHLSDLYGRRRLIMLGCSVMVLYPFAYFAMVDSGVFALLAVAIILSGPVHDLQFAPQAAFIAETFPASRRYSGVSLGFQLASITAGGPAPIVALYVFETFQTSTAIAALMSVSALISLAALSAMRDKAGELDREWLAAHPRRKRACDSDPLLPPNIGGNIVWSEGLWFSGMDQQDAEVYFAQFCFRGQCREDFERLYLGDYWSRDERIPRLRGLPDSRCVHVRELYTEAERKTSATYNEAMRSTETRDSLNVRLDGPDGRAG